MINFVNATEVITKKDYSEERVIELIKSFNQQIENKKEFQGKFLVNIKTNSDEEPLNESEFEVAKVNAIQNGWELTKVYRPSSNGYSQATKTSFYNKALTTYYLKKIKNIPAPQNFRIPINFRS